MSSIKIRKINAPKQGLNCQKIKYSFLSARSRGITSQPTDVVQKTKHFVSTSQRLVKRRTFHQHQPLIDEKADHSISNQYLAIPDNKQAATFLKITSNKKAAFDEKRPK